MEPPWAEPQSWVLIRPMDMRQLPGLCASSALVAAGASHRGQHSGEEAEQGSRLAAGRIQALTGHCPSRAPGPGQAPGTRLPSQLPYGLCPAGARGGTWAPVRMTVFCRFSSTKESTEAAKAMVSVPWMTTKPSYCP